MPTTIIALTVVALVVLVALPMAYARPPRFMRTRRQLADMFEAARVESERQTVEALIAAREAARP